MVFAENELVNINKKGEKKTYNNIKIWEKASTTNREKDINIRHKLSELKKQCRETTGFDNSELKNQKFLNKINI